MKKKFHNPYIEIVRLDTGESIQGSCYLQCDCDIVCTECDCVGDCIIIQAPSN